MDTLNLTVTPARDGFGAAVTGLDLSRPLPPPVLEAVKAAFARHSVLWFPDQPLTHDQLEAFTLQWGEFGWDPYIAPLADRPHILEVRRDAGETTSVFGGFWHSDWSFQITPPAITILHSKVIPPVGGDTLYADGYRAWEALTPAFRAMIAPLQAVHSAGRPYGAEGLYAKETGRTGMTILPSPEADKHHVHPLARAHPVTGRTALFVNPVYTIGIEGMDGPEGAAILGFLFKHMVKEEFVHRHQWQPNMLTMWDNRCCLHNATGGYDGHTRIMHRTTVAGEAPIPARA
jgi:taurine dioxygenase